MNFDQAYDIILWLQISIDQAVSQNKCFIIHRTTAAKDYVICRNTTQVTSQAENACIATPECIKVIT